MTGRREPPLTRSRGEASPRPAIRRRPWRTALRALPLMATLAATGWALSTNPLAAPWVDRSADDLTLALERAVRRTAGADWIASALAGAVAEGDGATGDDNTAAATNEDDDDGA